MFIHQFCYFILFCNDVAKHTLKIPAIAKVMLDVLANKRYSDTVNMNARKDPNKTNDMV